MERSTRTIATLCALTLFASTAIAQSTATQIHTSPQADPGVYSGRITPALFSRSLQRYAERSMRERIARLEANHQPKEAIRAFLAEIIDRSLKDPDRKGCLLVNSALDVAPHDAEIGKVVGGYLDELRAFFRRNIEAARAAGQVPRTIDAEEASGHLLGVLAGIRVLARTGAKRKLLEAVARPALDLLEGRR